MDDGGTGDEAFTAFVREHAAGLVNLAAHVYRIQPADAEDVVQVALVRVAARWSRVRDPLSYARRCVVTSGIDRHRRLARRPAEDPVDPVTLGQKARVEAPAPDDRLGDALAALPLATRQVLVLRYYVGLTEVETAALLKRPLGSVKSTAHRGIGQLRGALTTSPRAEGHCDAVSR